MRTMICTALIQLMLLCYAASQEGNETVHAAGSGAVAPSLPALLPPASVGNETNTNATGSTGVEIAHPAVAAAVPSSVSDTTAIAQNSTSPDVQSKQDTVESAKPTVPVDAGIVAPAAPSASVPPVITPASANDTAVETASHNATTGDATEPAKDATASDPGTKPALPPATLSSTNDTAPLQGTNTSPAAEFGTGMIQPALPAVLAPFANDTVLAARSQDVTGAAAPTKSVDAGPVQPPLPAVVPLAANDTTTAAVSGNAEAASGGQKATETVEPVQISAATSELPAPTLTSSNDTAPSMVVNGTQVETGVTEPAKPAAAVPDAGIIPPALPVAVPLPSNETVAPAGAAATTDAQVGPGMVAPALPVGIPPTANEISSTGISNATAETPSAVPVKTVGEGKETDTATVQGDKAVVTSPVLPAASVISETAVKEPRALQAANQKDGAQFTANFKTLSAPSSQNPAVWSALDDIRGRSRLSVDAIQQILAAAVPGQDYPNLATIPETSFSCERVNQPGFYADPASRCQVFRRCDANAIQWSYLCPNATIFNQITLTCDWFFNVDCAKSANYYDYSNSRLYNAGWIFLDTPTEAQGTTK